MRFQSQHIFLWMKTGRTKDVQPTEFGDGPNRGYCVFKSGQGPVGECQHFRCPISVGASWKTYHGRKYEERIAATTKKSPNGVGSE